jgi:GDPmannose 4,6-dehydratase
MQPVQKKALITGITGQDGIHLTKFLTDKGYRIAGVVSGQKNPRAKFIIESFPGTEIFEGDLTDISSIMAILEVFQPDEVYNLGAISFVGLSFKQPELTANVTGLGVLRLLEAIRKLNLEKKVKVYQASSSEMFGKVRETPQNELTPFYPRSPYGVAKTFAHYTCVNYRESYGMFISCGILFNHEGEYRGHEFVTRKITQNVAKIKLGVQKSFKLGNIESKRDWGYAGDYVQAMWLMLQQDQPSDYVIATGKTYSVRDFLELTIQIAELPGKIEDYVEYDLALTRPSEVDLLIGDASKARSELGWTPPTTFRELVTKMYENDFFLESKNLLKP